MSPLWVTCGSQVCGSEAVFLGGGCAAACGSTHTPTASMAEYCASEILRNHPLLRLLSTWQVRMNLIRLHMATHGYIIDRQDWFHMISRFHSIFSPKGAIEVLQFMAILTSLGPTAGTRGMAMAWINLAQLLQRSKRFLTILLLLFCLFFTLVYGFRGTIDMSNIHQICVIMREICVQFIFHYIPCCHRVERQGPCSRWCQCQSPEGEGTAKP